MNIEFNWPDIFAEAQAKDSWVNELHVVRMIGEADVETLMKDVNWVEIPDFKELRQKLDTIAKDIVRGEENSLFRPS